MVKVEDGLLTTLEKKGKSSYGGAPPQQKRKGWLVLPTYLKILDSLQKKPPFWGESHIDRKLTSTLKKIEELKISILEVQAMREIIFERENPQQKITLLDLSKYISVKNKSPHDVLIILQQNPKKVLDDLSTRLNYKVTFKEVEKILKELCAGWYAGEE